MLSRRQFLALPLGVAAAAMPAPFFAAATPIEATAIDWGRSAAYHDWMYRAPTGILADLNDGTYTGHYAGIPRTRDGWFYGGRRAGKTSAMVRAAKGS
jgi:hypothetical protein